MRKLKFIRRKFIATLFFSLITSIIAIIHGIFFDLDLNQLKRLSLESFIVTFIVIFPALLLLEWIFDLENHEQFRTLNDKIRLLEKKQKTKKFKLKKFK